MFRYSFKLSTEAVLFLGEQISLIHVSSIHLFHCFHHIPAYIQQLVINLTSSCLGCCKIKIILSKRQISCKTTFSSHCSPFTTADSNVLTRERLSCNQSTTATFLRQRKETIKLLKDYHRKFECGFCFYLACVCS